MYLTRVTVSFSPLSLIVTNEWPIFTGPVVQQTSPSLVIALVKQAFVVLHHRRAMIDMFAADGLRNVVAVGVDQLLQTCRLFCR